MVPARHTAIYEFVTFLKICVLVSIYVELWCQIPRLVWEFLLLLSLYCKVAVSLTDYGFEIAAVSLER